MFSECSVSDCSVFGVQCFGCNHGVIKGMEVEIKFSRFDCYKIVITI